METTNEILKQLRTIGESNNCDIIEIISFLDNRPVYRLRNSRIPKGHKTGRPFLLSVNMKGKIFELDSSQVHHVIVSYNGFCKRIQ